MKHLIIIAFVLSSLCSYAQSINDYKYVIVSNQYEFQKEANEYRLNELMVFLLKKYGFEAYRNNEVLPFDLNRGTCNGMTLKVEKSGTLWSDITARLVGCNNEVLYETPKVRSREKSFQKAYFSAVREAFESFQLAGYEYNGGNTATTAAQDAAASSILLSNQKQESTATKTPSRSQESRKKELQEAIEQRIQARRFDYEDTSVEEYALKFNESGDSFELFKHGTVIGKGRKSAAGVYLVTSDDFTGIGFVEGETFIIEYDLDGISRKITLIK